MLRNYLFLFLVAATSIFAEEKQEDVAEGSILPEVVPSLVHHWRSFDSAKKKYHNSLKRARKLAVSGGKVSEVEKIDQALSGPFTGNFELYGAKAAQKAFESSLGRTTKSMTSTLKREIKKLLGEEDGLSKAKSIEATIKLLSDSREESEPGKKDTFIVNAASSWQTVEGVDIKKGQTIQISVAGTWAPPSKEELPKGDADKYPVEVGIDKEVIGKSGKSSNLKANKAGSLSFRMGHTSNEHNKKKKKKKKKKKGPKGTGTVEVSFVIHNAFSGSSLESILSELLAPVALEAQRLDNEAALEEKKTSTSKRDRTVTPSDTNIVGLYGDRDWQDMGVKIKKGAFVTISASGTWTDGITTGSDGRHEGLNSNRKTPDELKMEGRVGNSHCGHGGYRWTFSAKESGTLFLRMKDYDQLSQTGDPDGLLQLRITVTSN